MAVARRALPALSFRAFLEDEAFCKLDLSPAIAAIADASEGRRVSLGEGACRAIFNCDADQLPTSPRRTVAVSAGGRGGKSSRLLAPKALHAAWTVPLPDVRPGERGRAVIIAPNTDLADADLDYVRGYAEESPVISRYLLPSPKTCVRIKRLDGTVVDVRVGAASRGGKAARARSLVFCALEESAFFSFEEGAAVTDKEIYRAAIQRVVPGGQVWIVSTPWIEEQGLLEERIKADWGRHESTLVVARVGTRMLNPKWDPDRSIDRDMRADDPENAAREIDAIPLAAGTSVFFDPVAIGRCFDAPAFAGTRAGVGAGGDFGFTSDCLAAALVAAHRGEDGVTRYDWFDAHERRPTRGEPLKPSVSVREVGRFAVAGGASALMADGHYKESVREHLSEEGVAFVAAPEGADGKADTYIAARRAMSEGRLRISVPDPALRERIKSQLRSITKKSLPSGGISISAPRRRSGPQGGTVHGDLVSAGVLALWRVGAGRAARSVEDSRVMGAGSLRGRASRRSADRCARCMHPVARPGERCARCYPEAAVSGQ